MQCAQQELFEKFTIYQFYTKFYCLSVEYFDEVRWLFLSKKKRNMHTFLWFRSNKAREYNKNNRQIFLLPMVLIEQSWALWSHIIFRQILIQLAYHQAPNQSENSQYRFRLTKYEIIQNQTSSIGTSYILHCYKSKNITYYK